MLNGIAVRTIALCLVLITGPCDAQTFALNRSFDLRVGENLRLSDSNFSIKFIEVENESRCAIGATCVWEGDAAAKFEVSAGGASQSITLHTNRGHPDIMPNKLKILGRTISLVKLAPYPGEAAATGRKAYVATLSIS